MAGVFTHNGNVVEGLPSIASQINYDNTNSGMVATQVQAAVDELKSGLIGKQNSLELGEADDLNEVKTNGCCIFNTSTLNTPVTGDGIVSTSYTEVSGYWFSLQIAIVFNSNTAYIRYSRNGWGAWKSFTLT